MAKVKIVLKIIFLASGIIFLWFGSAYFLGAVLSRKPAAGAVSPSMSDLATIFFGASSLALIIFSLLLAIAAIIEWQSLKADIRKEIDSADVARAEFKKARDENESRVKGLEKEIQGRVFTVMGVTLGTLHSDSLALVQKEEHRGYIAEALLYCRKGYEILKDLDGDGKYMALNNVVYYSCLIEVESNRELLLDQARQVKSIGLKYENSPHTVPYFLTFCRAILVYGSKLDEVSGAYTTAEDLLKRPLTSLQRKEATMLAASLDSKRRELLSAAS